MTGKLDAKLQEILRCPKCRQPLAYLEGEQQLECAEHGRYPITDGIPSFCPQHDFDEHWDKNYVPEIPKSKKVVARQFLQPLFDYVQSHGVCSVFDAGSGNGVHMEVILEDNGDGPKVSGVGMDISLSALRASRERKHHDWQFVHGDVGSCPFNDEQFDAVYSFGVLAYTDDPQHSFSEICRITKPGGLVGVWIYPKVKGIMGALFSIVRKTCQLTGPIGTRIIADCIVPLLGLLPTRSGLNLKNASWKQCREVVLVNIEPDLLYFPEPALVEGWFLENDITICFRDDEAPVTLWGIKNKETSNETE
jgi:LSD1 subclass zinc finger protein